LLLSERALHAETPETYLTARAQNDYLKCAIARKARKPTKKPQSLGHVTRRGIKIKQLIEESYARINHLDPNLSLMDKKSI